MANTLIAATGEQDGDRTVWEGRSTDLDPWTLAAEHGPLVVYDKTDGMRLVGTINEKGYLITIHRFTTGRS